MTIQQVISKTSALHNLVMLLAKSLPSLPADLPVSDLMAELVEESGDLVRSVKAVGSDMGAGFFPNTFTKDGAYRLVHNESEKAAAVADGWVVATFPETMLKPGCPDIVVHDSVHKALADKDGYRLPGLGVESGS